MPKCVLQFMAAAADKSFEGDEVKLVLPSYYIAGFAGELVVEENLAGHNSPFGFLTALTNSALHKRLIKASHT